MACPLPWRNNQNLVDQMKLYVAQGLKRVEIVDFMIKEFPQNSWSLRTFARRLKFFEISYTDSTVSVDQVLDAVSEELQGPGRLLGYRALQKKLRQVHQLNVPRAVHDAMYMLDPEALEDRQPCKKKAKKKGHFVSNGPNWVYSFDGHDKLMGYQNNTFPLAIYGCIDTASRKILWLKIWVSNSDPVIIGKWFLQHVLETKRISNMIRLDKGTETGDLATMHCYLRAKCEPIEKPEDAVIYGPSTSNQIERWWKELHERMEKYYKEQLDYLKDQGHYNPNDEMDRMLLAFIMIPVLQKELDEFKEVIWNPHRIRFQENQILPDGVPNHIYAVPEKYGLEESGYEVSDEYLRELQEDSGIDPELQDFLDPDFRRECPTWKA